MTYQEFKSHIMETAQNALGPDVTVAIHDILKNNDTHLDGLTVLSNNSNISPTIYLNHYYRQYEKGRPLTDICKELLAACRENLPEGSIDISFFTCYDKVKSNIIFKLVNYEKNREMLTEVPHFRFLDLAVIFSCLLQTDSGGSATILIHNQHLSYWNITKDDLYALAFLNTPRLLQYDLRNMTDILKELTDGSEELPEDTFFSPCPMYMLSNRSKLNGSACLLYRDLLKNFADRLNSDLYILPSSVHEVLIIPAASKTFSDMRGSCGEAADASYRALSDMVKEVNATQLSPEDILSDHVYYFSRESCRLTM